MDHHCPWVNNCVGYGNYRYFCNFLIYLWTGTAYVMLTGLQIFSHATGRTSQIFMFQYILCMGVNLCMVLFLGFHGFLVLSNQSTIELWSNTADFDRTSWRQMVTNLRNPYHLGIYRNLVEVYGEGKWYFWLLPSTRRPPGDGMIYRLATRLLNSPRYSHKAPLVEVGYQMPTNKRKPEPPTRIVVESGSRPTPSHASNGTSVNSRHAPSNTNGSIDHISADVLPNGTTSRLVEMPSVNEANEQIDERASLLVTSAND